MALARRLVAMGVWAKKCAVFVIAALSFSFPCGLYIFGGSLLFNRSIFMFIIPRYSKLIARSIRKRPIKSFWVYRQLIKWGCCTKFIYRWCLLLALATLTNINLSFCEVSASAPRCDHGLKSDVLAQRQRELWQVPAAPKQHICGSVQLGWVGEFLTT